MCMKLRLCTDKQAIFLDFAVLGCIIKCFTNLLRCDLAEIFKNLLIFDASSANVFFGGTSGKSTVFKCGNFEKSKLGRFLPEEFEKTVSSLDLTGDTRVIVGNGPGAFTGIKTGTAFFLAYIYSLGITKVETTSSFSFISALFDFGSADSRLVLIPFNKGEYFASILDRSGKVLKSDIFIKPPYTNISETADGLNLGATDAAAPVECGEEILPELKKVLNINNIRFNGFKFDPERFSSLSDTKVVDIINSPYIINHVVMPANLDSGGNFYVENQL